MSNENPIVTWAVQLTGNAGTLPSWEQLFADPETALVERRLEAGKAEFFLRSARFDGLPGNEVRGVASELLGKMSSVIAQFAGADPISIGNCLAIFADGGWAKPVVADFPLLIEVSPTSGAITFSQAEKTQVLRLLMLAEREDHVADTLRFLYRGTWFDLYFACEVMADDCGGQHELMKRRWAKEHELELVRQNANLYRHARPKCRPSRLLSLEEARGLLERAIWGWLAEKS